MKVHGCDQLCAHGYGRAAGLIVILVAAALSVLPANPDGELISAQGPIGAVGDVICSGTSAEVDAQAQADAQVGDSGSSVEAGAGGDTDTLSGVTCALRATEVIYVTNWGADGDTPLRRQMLSVVGVPTPLDVDDRLGFDIVATVRPLLSGSVELEINKLVGANSTLPVAVVAFVNDPADATLRYTFGYDARRSSAPQTFSETFVPRPGGLGVTVSSSGEPRPSSVALLGRRTKLDGTSGQVLETVEARVGFAPLPLSINGDVSNAEETGGMRATAVTLTVSDPTKVDVNFRDAKRSSARLDFLATLENLEQSVGATLTQSPVEDARQSGAERTQLTITSEQRTESRLNADLTMTETATGSLLNKTQADLEGVPTSATLTLAPETTSSPQTISLTASHPFGLVDVARANGEPRRLSDDAYAYVFTDGDFNSTAARIRGLETATLELGDDVRVRATAAPDAFRVLVDEIDKGKRTEADIQNLPRTVDFTLRPKGTPTVEYEGSDEIALVKVRVHDEAGITRSSKTGVAANDLLATLTDIPTEVSASFVAPAGGSATVDVEARDSETGQLASIGNVQVQLWTRPATGVDDDLPHVADRQFVADLGAEDGALVRDLPDRYVIFARLAALEQLHLELDQQLIEVGDAEKPVVHAAAPFHAVVEEQSQPTGPRKRTDAEIRNLPGRVELTLMPTANPTVDYKGSAPIGQVKVRVHDDAGVATSERTGLTASDLLLTIEDLPTGVIANLDPSGRDLDLNTTGEIGNLEAQLWTPRAGDTSEQLPDSDDRQFVTDLGTAKDGVLVRDLNSRYVVFARVAKLKAANLMLDPNAPDVRLTSGSRRDVHVSVANTTAAGGGTEEITATVANRPLCLRFRLAKDFFTSPTCSAALGSLQLPNPDPLKQPTTILYEGSETTGRIDASVKGFVSLAGQELIARLDGVTPRLEAVVEGAGPTPERIELAARGGDGDIDLVEMRLRSGRVDAGDVLDPDPATDATLDGLLMRNTLQAGPPCCPFDRKVVFARISRLVTARVLTMPTLRVEVDSTAGRPFKLIKEEDKERTVVMPGQGPVNVVHTDYLRATASALQRNTVLTFSDITGAAKIGYRADGEIASLDLDTNVTGSLFLRANATNVARRLDLCIHPGAPHAGLSGDSAVCEVNALGHAIPQGPTVVASAAAPLDPANPMEVDFLDCKKLDNDGGCGVDKGPAQFVRFDDLRFQRLALQLHQVKDQPTQLYLDTDRSAASGKVLILLPPGGEVAKVHATIPKQGDPTTSNLSAEDRRVTIGKNAIGFPKQDAWSGDIACPQFASGGYNFELFVTASFLGINAGLEDVLCSNPDDPQV